AVPGEAGHRLDEELPDRLAPLDAAPRRIDVGRVLGEEVGEHRPRLLAGVDLVAHGDEALVGLAGFPLDRIGHRSLLASGSPAVVPGIARRTRALSDAPVRGLRRRPARTASARTGRARR